MTLGLESFHLHIGKLKSKAIKLRLLKQNIIRAI